VHEWAHARTAFPNCTSRSEMLRAVYAPFRLRHNNVHISVPSSTQRHHTHVSTYVCHVQEHDKREEREGGGEREREESTPMPVQSDWAFCQCKITRVVVLPLLSMSPQPLALHCCGLADAVALLRSPNAASVQPESLQRAIFTLRGSHFTRCVEKGVDARGSTLAHTHTNEHTAVAGSPTNVPCGS